MRASGLRLFIVIGRTGHSLIVSKALPFAALEGVKEIYIFSETRGFDIPKSRYIIIPGWFRRIRPIFIGKTIRFIFEPLQILFYALKLKPDIINGVYCLPKGLNSFIVSKLTGAKCIISVIGSRLEIETELPFRNIWQRINLFQLKYCNAIAVKGETDRNYLISKNIEPLKLFPLNGAIDIEKFSLTKEKKTIDLLFVGTFYELKGPDRFIKIVQGLLKYFPDLKATMLGAGKMLNDSKKMASDLQLNHVIKFEGFQKSTFTFFQHSKVLVMPSRSESLSTAMLEAMACGCVPVVSDVGNVREAAIESVNSKIISDYLDIDSFIFNIKGLLQDPEKLKEYALEGRMLIEKRYSVHEQSKIAKEIIDSLKNK